MPNHAETYDKAIQLQQQGDLEGAVRLLEELLKSESQYALAHAALSVFYAAGEDYEQAISHGRRVCELEPNDPFSFVAMSLICQKAGRLPEAEQALMQARQVELTSRQQREP